MHSFEMTLQRQSAGAWPVVVEHVQPGGLLPVRAEGSLQFDPVELRAHGAAREYGTLLGKALFRDEIRDAFVRARSASDGSLRVLLTVEDAALKTLHWERLCAPFETGWDFLAIDQRTPFSLYLPSLADRRFPPIGARDLRALVLAASPDDLEDFGLARFDAAAAAGTVCAALGAIPADVLASGAAVAGAIGPATLDALCERITAGAYTLLHVVCHGQVLDGETVLYLARPGGGCEPVPAARLIERLARLQGALGLPQLAFLATCESAAPEAEGALGGLAQRLVRELGMPAVVAMTERVTVATATALAQAFYERLRAHGVVDQALAEACAGLAARHDITVPALFSRLGGRPLFSDSLDRALTAAELTFGLERLPALFDDRAPVLRPALDTQAAILRRTPDAGAPDAAASALSDAARKERDAALAEVNVLCLEALDLSFHALATGQDAPAYDGRCPFRGLYPFRAEDRAFFFGREALITRLAARLPGNGFLAVLGPSGSGKSSVVLAGLGPALGCEPLAFTPGEQPLARLDASLAGREAALLVVDQFEELFTLCRDDAQRKEFITRLLARAGSQRVVVTMRADFWGECAPYPALREAMQAQQELIPPMDANELRRAMELQAQAVGLRFEADLADAILDDVQGEPGAMPLLQHALLELWKRRHGRWLRAAEYRAVGGVQRAIATTAEELFKSLTAAEQEQARLIFIRLTRLDEQAASGEERRDTRRRAWLDELVPAGAQPAATRDLVRRLADARLVVTRRVSTSPQDDGRDEVEVAHEALIRYWPRLRGWLDENRDSLILHRQITEDAQQWQLLRAREGDQSGADSASESVLYRGMLLNTALAWAGGHTSELNALEKEFLDRSHELALRVEAEREAYQRRMLEDAQKLAEAQRKRAEDQALAAGKLQRLARFLTAALVIAGLAALIAVIAGLSAVDNARVANQNAGTAEAGKATAEVASNLRARAEALAILASNDSATAEAIAVQERDTAARQARQARSGQLAVQAQAALGSYPQRAELLAIEALSLTLRAGDAGAPASLEALYRASSGLGGVPLPGTALSTASAASPDGHWLAIVRGDAAIELWDLNDPAGGARALLGVVGTGHVPMFTADSRTLIVTASLAERGQSLQRWDPASAQAIGRPVILSAGEDPLAAGVAAVSPDGHWAAIADYTGGGAYLWDLQSADPAASRTTLDSSSDMKRAIAFSPDSRWLATGDYSGEASLWDLRAPDPAAARVDYRDHRAPVKQLAFSPDSRWLATAAGKFEESGNSVDPDSVIHLKRLTDLAAPDIALQGHRGAISAIVFSADGRWLATGAGENARTGEQDGSVRLWDLAALARDPSTAPTVLSRHRAGISAIAFSDDGRWLLSGSSDGGIILSDMAQPDQQNADVPMLGHTAEILALRVSPDSHWAVSTGQDGSVRLWNLQAPGNQVFVIHAHEGFSPEVAFDAKSRWLITVSDDTTPRLWDLRAASPAPLPLRVQMGGLSSISRNGRWIAGSTITNPGAAPAGVWAFGRLDQPVQILPGSSSPLGFSADERWLVTGYDPREQNDSILLWDLNAATPQPQKLPGAALPAALSGDGRRLASAAEGDSRIWLWSLDAPDPSSAPLAIEGSGEKPSALIISPGGGKLVADTKNSLLVWNTTDPARQADRLARPPDVYINSAGISADGRWLALAYAGDQDVQLWDISAHPPVSRTLRGYPNVVDLLAFSPDSSRLAVAGYDTTVYLWNLAAPDAAPSILHGHEAYLSSVAFSVDGRWLVTASQDEAVLLWDARDLAAAPIALHLGDLGWSPSAFFSRDANWLVTSDSYSTLAWDLRPEQLTRLACSVVGRNLTPDEWAQYFPGEPYRATCAQWPTR